MKNKQYDLIVIGAGPGGYVAAIRASQLGMSVACIDANSQLGGTCLRVGCIPSKVMLESSERYHEAKTGLADHGVLVDNVGLDLDAMHLRREKTVKMLAGGVAMLFKQNKVDRFEGRGRLEGAGRVAIATDDGETSLRGPRILLATGSVPATIPSVPVDHDRICTSDDAICFPTVPEHLVVIGAGYIGLEMGSVWARLGAKVTVLEAMDNILPGMDMELAKVAKKLFKQQGLSFQLGVKVREATASKGGCRVTCEEGDPIECDRVLVAIGRVANTSSLGLDAVGLQADRRGELTVDDAFETPVAGVYAIGDCIRGPKLAHKASHEAIACVEQMAGNYGHVNYDAIPGVCYTHPELATVGRTEEQLKQDAIDYRKAKFPFQASGRARSLGDTSGMVKVLADSKTDRILGVHILGPRAGDLIAEAVAAIEFGASAEDLAHVCHAHPTLAESLGEAAMGISGRAIHMAQAKKR